MSSFLSCESSMARREPFNRSPRLGWESMLYSGVCWKDKERNAWKQSELCHVSSLEQQQLCGTASFFLVFFFVSSFSFCGAWCCWRDHKLRCRDGGWSWTSLDGFVAQRRCVSSLGCGTYAAFLRQVVRDSFFLYFHAASRRSHHAREEDELVAISCWSRMWYLPIDHHLYAEKRPATTITRGDTLWVSRCFLRERSWRKG